MKQLTLLFTAFVIAVPIMLSTWNAQTTPEQTEEPAPRPTAVTTQAVATARANLPSIHAQATSLYHSSRNERHVIEGFEGFEYRCESEQLLGDDHAMRAACHNMKVEYETLYDAPCAWTIDAHIVCLWSPVTDKGKAWTWDPDNPPPYVTIQPTPVPRRICERGETARSWSCRRNPEYAHYTPVPTVDWIATWRAATPHRIAPHPYITPASPDGHVGAVANIDVAPPAATALQSMVENFPLDAAATALQSMVDNPGYRPTLATGCDQLPRDAAHAAACNAYKAAYEARYGNPCRHDIDGAAVCLH